MLILITIEVIVFKSSKNNFDIPTSWVNNLREKCGVKKLRGAFFHASLNQTSYLAIGYGAYLGTIAQSYYYRGRVNLRKPIDHHRWKAIGRTLVNLVLIAPLIIIFLTLTEDQISNDFWLMICKNFLPLIFIVGILFMIGDNVCLFLKLFDLPMLVSTDVLRKSIDLEEEEGPVAIYTSIGHSNRKMYSMLDDSENLIEDDGPQDKQGK